MTKHVVSTTKCNLGCSYCYEEPGREYDQPDINSDYDMDKIMDMVEKWVDEAPNEPVGVHGGEPLVMRDEDLEEIFSYVYNNSNAERTHIQTNGTLITDEHIRMFKEYNVHVGISCDGPAELNDEREARSKNKDITKKMTQATHDSIDRLIEEDINMGLIIVLHKINAGTDEKLEKLHEWMDYLNQNDIHGHFNPAIPYEGIQEDISLSPERLNEVYQKTWDWILEENYRTWNPFRDMQDNLLGNSLKSCVNGKCDVFNTQAAQSITGDGNTSGCGKAWETVGDGTTFLMGESTNNEFGETEERYEMLKQVPGPHTEEVKNGEIEDQGGCKGCKYWNVCHGGCPASGMDDDYRNRTVWCDAKYEAYEKLESDMKRMFPNLDTITDIPWDIETGNQASNGGIDFKPFSGIAQSESLKAGVENGIHDKGPVSTRFKNGELPFEDVVKSYKEEYPADMLTIDIESESIHADSS